MKTSAKWGVALLCFFLALASPAQPVIQTNSTFGWATLHTFPQATAITLGQNGLIYGVVESSPPSIYEISTNGALLWTTAVTNAAAGLLTNILQGADGNLYLYGSAAVVSASTNGAVNWVLPPTNNDAVNWLTFGADGNLYGASHRGGADDRGQAVAISPTGSYLWAFSFDSTNYGATPSGPILQASDGNLYGAEATGLYSLSGDGTFRWRLVFPTPEQFPAGNILQGNDGSLYCQDPRSIVNCSTNGTTNWDLPLTTSGAGWGRLFQGADGNIYGGGGVAFCLTPSGVFLWTSPKAQASLLLQRLDSYLYGRYENGPGLVCVSSAGQPVASSAFASATVTALVQDQSGIIYGSVASNNAGGLVFELLPGPHVLSQPADTIAPKGPFNAFGFTNTVNYIGAPPLSFQWQKDGTNLTDGSAFGGTVRGSLTNQITLQNVKSNASGLYRLVISNGFGLASTLPFYLTTTNRFPTLVPNGVFSVPDPTNFSGDQRLSAPTALAAGLDGTLYISAFDGEWLIRAQTNGGLRLDGLFGEPPTYVASLVQGLDGDVFCDSKGEVFLCTSNGVSGGRFGAYGAFETKIIMGPDGTLYWTGDGNGTLISAATETGLQNYERLWSYTNTYGDFPESVALGGDGNLYATASIYTNPVGRVFSFSTNGNTLWSFSFDGDNGFFPSDIMQGADGNLYGATWGVNFASAEQLWNTNGSDAYGSLFCMSTNGVLLWTYIFDGTHGSAPQPPLLQGPDGYIYGTTAGGGSFGLGTVYRIAPGGVDHTVIHEFTGGADGANPPCGLVQLSDGSYYGITQNGGVNSNGVLFRLDLPPAPGAAVFRSATITNSTISLTFAAIPSRAYQLQYSTDLSTWTNLNAPIVAAQSLMTVQDAIASGPQRFYRLVRQ